MKSPNRPTFLGIGAQRAGTSWLYSQLIEHTQIWMPPIKELHFFDRSPVYSSPNDLASTSLSSRLLGSEPYQRSRMITGIKKIFKELLEGNYSQAIWFKKWYFGNYDEGWYSNLFSSVPSDMICGEITPSYSILQGKDVEKIKDLNEEVKLIYIIRNPIERSWSAVRFHAFKGHKCNIDSVDQVISLLRHPAMELRSDYERTLDIFLKHFDSKQLLLCFYDAIEKDPMGLLGKISEFLEVTPFTNGQGNHNRRINPSPSHKMPEEVREYLVEKYSPMIHRIAKETGGYASLWCNKDGDGSQDIRGVDPEGEISPAIHL